MNISITAQNAGLFAGEKTLTGGSVDTLSRLIKAGSNSLNDFGVEYEGFMTSDNDTLWVSPFIDFPVGYTFRLYPNEVLRINKTLANYVRNLYIKFNTGGSYRWFIGFSN
jgi:hypothetical protein